MRKALLVFGILAVGFAVTGMLNNQPQKSSVIYEWLMLQQQLIRNTSGVPHVAFSRHFSYTSIALYEQSLQTRLAITVSQHSCLVSLLPKPRPKSTRMLQQTPSWRRCSVTTTEATRSLSG